MAQGKKKKTLSLVLSAIMAVLYIAGVGLLFYPFISNHIIYAQQYETVVSYDDRVQHIDPQLKQRLLDEARAYNEKICRKRIGYRLNDRQRAEYDGIMNVDDNAVMGHIRIPKIDVSLLIYHSVDDKYLQVGAGHLPGSSFPIGGLGTNAILMGHRGLTTATLFTNLDRLEIGDKFILTVLEEKLAYEIDDISVIEPIEVHDINIDPAQDYCTLITCTPYGVNSHRLVLRGHRVPYEQAAAEGDVGMTESYSIRVPRLSGKPDLSEILALAGIVVLLLGLVALIVRAFRSLRNKRSYTIA